MTCDIDPECDLDLEWQNNATNAFPVSDNLGVGPRAIICFHMMIGYWDMAHFQFLHCSCGGHFEYENQIQL